MKLTCIKDVSLKRSAQITFFKGFEYDFTMHTDGSVSRFDVQTGYHSFSADVWAEFFKFELEVVL